MYKTVTNNAAYIGMICTALFFTGCGKNEEFVAKIDNEVITAEELDNRISKLPDRYQEVIRANKKKFLDEYIVDELLYKEAVRLDLHRDAELKEIIEEAKKKILIAKLLKEVIDDMVTVQDTDTQEYYDTHQEEFVTPEILRASHVLVQTPEEAQRIAMELSQGGDFSEIARRESLDPSSARGGDIGYFVRGQLNPDFEKFCFQMEEGELSGVVKTDLGYHVIKLTERKQPSIEKFADVRARIGQNLLMRRKKQAFNELVERLRSQAKIVINEESPALSPVVVQEKND